MMDMATVTMLAIGNLCKETKVSVIIFIVEDMLVVALQ